MTFLERLSNQAYTEKAFSNGIYSVFAQYLNLPMEEVYGTHQYSK